ncbi:hypothetical protein Pyrfu_1372 [Pyrolobus fumarii 1A]|uniref:Thioredoxin domain-containing protein n=1 Tax=Pyrolobus fumarii (strain DSM 11204 / 1A) TaxID=694429 RepID=G0EGT2_PYRF1|nr:thioredoxin family protein [Pyrolobus fumarii]AEM39230.1 hypothetical protein Pyrfu_1372 [Pyrolobus fumarii 1A]
MAREQYRGMVVILFYNNRCSYCKRILREWRRFVASHRGEAVFLALPYNRATRKLFEQYDVYEVPTLIIVKNGEVIARIDGVRRIEQVEEVYAQLTINTV